MEAKGENRVRVEAGQKSTQEKGVSGSEEAEGGNEKATRRESYGRTEREGERKGEGWLKDSEGRSGWAEG